MKTPLDYIPQEIIQAQDYESLANAFLDPTTYAYISGGAATEASLKHNRNAFDAYQLHPKLLQDVTHGNLKLNLEGQTYPHPIWLGPVAFQKLAHKDGELATSRAAQAMACPFILSTLSSFSLETVAQTVSSEKWFQLYFQPSKDATLDLIKRAENQGYSKIVVTLDASIQSPSPSAIRAGFKYSDKMQAANLIGYKTPEATLLESHDNPIFQGYMTEAPGLADIEWLLEQTHLPVWVKGVLRSDDAQMLKEIGISGQIISNHGGRVLDHVISPLVAITSIRQAVGKDYPLLLDSGIRSGTDIFKALALGADAVLIGRLQVYALAVAGALGVAHLLKTLQQELSLCMALTGCATLNDITADRLYLNPFHNRTE